MRNVICNKSFENEKFNNLEILNEKYNVFENCVFKSCDFTISKNYKFFNCSFENCNLTINKQFYKHPSISFKNCVLKYSRILDTTEVVHSVHNFYLDSCSILNTTFDINLFQSVIKDCTLENSSFLRFSVDNSLICRNNFKNCFWYKFSPHQSKFINNCFIKSKVHLYCDIEWLYNNSECFFENTYFPFYESYWDWHKTIQEGLKELKKYEGSK